MEKGVLNIELMNGPRSRDGDTEDDADHGRLDDGTEGLIKVYPRLLREAADHPSSLVAGKAAVRVELVLEDPFP
jgi:hypothetical protein